MRTLVIIFILSLAMACGKFNKNNESFNHSNPAQLSRGTGSSPRDLSPTGDWTLMCEQAQLTGEGKFRIVFELKKSNNRYSASRKMVSSYGEAELGDEQSEGFDAVSEDIQLTNCTSLLDSRVGDPFYPVPYLNCDGTIGHAQVNSRYLEEEELKTEVVSDENIPLMFFKIGRYKEISKDGQIVTLLRELFATGEDSIVGGGTDDFSAQQCIVKPIRHSVSSL